MYVPRQYVVETAQAWDVVIEAGAGVLVVATSHGLRSVLVPVVVSSDRQHLRGHVSRANPWWRDARDGDAVLGVFQLAHSYISPSFYPTKESDPAVVPTWDYVVSEVGGTLRLHDDAAWVESLVRELSTSFEARREQPWSVDDAPADYVGALAKGIVGFDVEVTSITGAAKLSQNKGDVDRRGVRDGLEQGDRRSRDLAARMDVGP